MNKLYGFGNALIDIEISIDDADLDYLEIPKGNMKHVSAEERDIYINRFRENIISYQPGGSIANSIYAFSDNKKESFFGCSLGQDNFRDQFLEGFSKLTTPIINESDKDTGVCFIFVTEDGERTMASYLGANEDLCEKVINEEILGNCDGVIFDSFSVFTDSGFKTLKHCLDLAKSYEVEIFFGLSDSELIKMNQEKLDWIISKEVDYIFGNKSEILTLSSFCSIKDSQIIQTNGKHGASFKDIEVTAPSTKVENTNGAGDAFIGTFIAKFDQDDISQALRDSVNYAAQVCETNGPRQKKRR